MMRTGTLFFASVSAATSPAGPAPICMAVCKRFAQEATCTYDKDWLRHDAHGDSKCGRVIDTDGGVDTVQYRIASLLILALL